jgi:hypothetical protein
MDLYFKVTDFKAFDAMAHNSRPAGRVTDRQMRK